MIQVSSSEDSDDPGSVSAQDARKIVSRYVR